MCCSKYSLYSLFCLVVQANKEVSIFYEFFFFTLDLKIFYNNCKYQCWKILQQSFNSISQANVRWPALVQTTNPFSVFADASSLTWPGGNNLTNDLLFMSDTMNPNLLVAQEEVSIKYLVFVTVEIVLALKTVHRAFVEATA